MQVFSRRPQFFLSGMAFIGIFLAACSPQPCAAVEKPTDNDNLKALLKERVAILSKIYDQTLQGFKGGQLGYDSVITAQTALLNGKIELCETNDERVKIHEELVKLAEQTRKHVQKLVEDKTASAVDLLKAEVQLLNARIGLEKAKTVK